MINIIKRLFDYSASDVFTSVGQEPVFDRSSRPLPTTPALPYSCEMRSFTNRKVRYTVKVSAEGFWSCSCLDYMNRQFEREAKSYYCKHCKTVSRITGIKCWTNRWRAKSSGRVLTGEITPDGMKVYGYLTITGLHDNFTPAQRKKFLGEPDEEAIFGDGGSCKLYLKSRVDEVLVTPEYRQAREKYFALAEKRKAAAVKAQETRERNHREMMERRATQLASFNGKIYIANLEYKYGWEKWGIGAIDIASATKLFKELMSSSDWKEAEKENFDNAKEEYKTNLFFYKKEQRKLVKRAEPCDLIEPAKPLRKEFSFALKEITEATDLEQKMFETNQFDFEIKEAEYLESGGGWEHNMYPEL